MLLPPRLELNLVSADQDLRFPPPTKPRTAEETAEADRKAKIVTTARDRFKLVEEAEGPQRQRERDDLQFDRALPEDQWPKEIRDSRKSGVAPDGSVIAERPCLVIPKLDQPIQQVVNEARQARLGIEIKAKGERANPQGAELRQGMIRAIEVDSNAQAARMWAVERAVKCGRGYYRILTEYANDGDFDLDVRVKRILNQGSVYEDPYATEPDGADVEWVILTNSLSKDEFKRRWPKADLSHADNDEWTSYVDQAPGWVTQDSLRVAEYFYVDHIARTLVRDPATGRNRLLEQTGRPLLDEKGRPRKDPETGDRLLATHDEPPPSHAKTRTVDERVVRWCTINAFEVLDEEEWPGRYIPIIRVIGKEYVVDGAERVFKGMISNAKDAQRSYNYMRSAQVEAIGLASKAPWLLDIKQIEPYLAWWGQANTRNLPYLPYRQWVDGVQYSAPIRNAFEPAIQGITLAVRESDADMKATTGRWEPSLGQKSGDRSGKAIEALQQQGANSSSNYLENLASISLTHEGRVHLDLLPHVYDRPGRVVRLLGEEDTDERWVMLGQPFTLDPDKRPVAVPPGPAPMSPPGLMGRMRALLPGQRPPGMPGMGGAAGPPTSSPQLYDLQDGGEYMCQVSIGRSAPTQREANIRLLTGLVEATKGQAAPALMDLIVEQMEGPTARKAVRRLRKLNPQLADDGDVTGLPTPEEAAALQQQVQQLSQQLQQTVAQLKTESFKVEAQVEMKRMELATQKELQALEIRADIAKTKATLTSKEAIAVLEVEETRLTDVANREHEAGLQLLKGVQKQREILLDAATTAALMPLQPPTGHNGESGAVTPGIRTIQPLPGQAPVGPSGVANDPRFQ